MIEFLLDEIHRIVTKPEKCFFNIIQRCQFFNVSLKFV